MYVQILINDCIVNEVNLSDHNAIAFKLVLPVGSNHRSDCNVHTTRPSVRCGNANCEQIARFKASVRNNIDLCFTNVLRDIFSCRGCVC
jgi:hypothetical protein